ncbi:hypothetical protein, partial [Pectobacterium versatile]|uniref:hypothetical protein n=1 Tax=Pectobacterium versatile TaxID=2488639 RepID=UPI001B37276D
RGATAIEPPRVGRVRRELQKITRLTAHETPTIIAEIRQPDVRAADASACVEDGIRRPECYEGGGL